MLDRAKEWGACRGGANQYIKDREQASAPRKRTASSAEEVAAQGACRPLWGKEIYSGVG
jgi:hypothetical protein